MKKTIENTPIDMVPVESKNITYIGHDEETSKLAIEFTRGPVYVYYDVPKSTYEKLLTASSLDDFFFESIKNSYKNKRVF